MISNHSYQRRRRLDHLARRQQPVVRSGSKRRLVSGAEQTAREHTCTRIAVTSAERRADAHALHERIGYTYTGRRFVKQLS